MANATIQFTQGMSVITAGQSCVGFTANTAVQATDAGGGGATYLWQVISYPGPLSAPPTVNNSTLQTCDILGTFVDGIYIVKLTRTDGSGTTTDIKFFGVADADGQYLPSAGMTGSMSNVGGLSAAQEVGWAGRASASNVFLDAFLRLLKKKVGNVAGLLQNVTLDNGATSPSPASYIPGVSGYNITNTRTSGPMVLQLGVTSPPEFAGERFEFLVKMAAGSSTLSFQNGTGAILVTLPSAPSGTSTIPYHVKFIFDGTDWALLDLQISDQKAVEKTKDFTVVAGTQGTGLDVFTRVGTVRIDPSLYLGGEFKFQATLEASVGQTAVCQVYNVTDGALVAGSTLTGVSTSPTPLEAVITLPSSLKLYEVQLKLGAPNGGTDRAAVTNAKILLSWG